MAELQPSPSRVETLSRWGLGWAGHDRRTGYALELDALTCAPASIPGLTQVHDVAGVEQRHVLGLSGSGLTLLREQGRGWSAVELHPELTRNVELTAVRLGVSGARLAVSLYRGGAPARFFVFDGGAWSVHDAPKWAERMSCARHLIFHRGRWLFGLSNGEFGGGLLTLSKEEGLRTVALGHQPVTAVVPDGDRLYVAVGQSHMGHRLGQLWAIEADGAAALLTSTEPGRVMFEWPGERDALMGFCLDGQRRPHLLLDAGGVVRLDGDHPTGLTPGYPAYSATDLALLGDGRALIAGWQYGVLVWKLGTPEFSQIIVPARRK